MKVLQQWMGFFGLIHLLGHSSLAQDYVWPTDASQFLTSSFAEYRPGHLHAGIDIKTWGQIGYKVFAIRDGYIARIGVSPYGYGKVLYQKLDTGEIAVYAHLDRFNDELHRFMKQEQQREGDYRIERYLERHRFPVRKGDVIGYTGASGIGSPHLHFEIRDANNNPTNPFLLGYRVADTIPPKVVAISITPLDVGSRVNSDVLPLIEKPTLTANGTYRFASTPLVSGNIGFAINCYDQADGVSNSFAVYKLDFYVDGTLCFTAKYDKFSYQVAHLIDLDRDFRLLSRGKGQFQKLYKDKFNVLPFYRPDGNEIGVLQCDPNIDKNSPIQNRLGRGEYEFTIQVYDFFGNLATITGNFIVAERKRLQADYQLENQNQLYISNIRDQEGHRIDRPSIFVSQNQGLSWQKMQLQVIDGDSSSDSASIITYLLKPVRPETIVKIQAVQGPGIETFPDYYLVKGDSFSDHPMNELRLERDFYDDYIRLVLSADELMPAPPKLFVQQIGLPPIEVSLWQNRFNEFIGVYKLSPGNDGWLSIEARGIDLADRELSYWEQFEVRTVSPERGGTIAATDRHCRVIFHSGSVYKNLYLRIENRGTWNDSNYDGVGEVYEIFPQDIPLKKSATIELKYPATDYQPDKLGIYQVGGKKPGFRGNKLDVQKYTISSPIANLGAFALIRDTTPPSVAIQQPQKNAMLRDKKPTLLATVYDELSGIANERSIIMRLDGIKLIAEFDPDAKTIKFEPDDPLLPGEHSLSVWAIDNCQNEVTVSQQFYVLE